ncbi:MAG: hypothetical protein K2Q14_00575, partial [Gammaproteobacteria bacterium]|nr:hypothetical protein [Gammaproteobacteria bacterium]
QSFKHLEQMNGANSPVALAYEKIMKPGLIDKPISSLSYLDIEFDKKIEDCLKPIQRYINKIDAKITNPRKTFYAFELRARLIELLEPAQRNRLELVTMADLTLYISDLLESEKIIALFIKNEFENPAALDNKAIFEEKECGVMVEAIREQLEVIQEPQDLLDEIDEDLNLPITDLQKVKRDYEELAANNAMHVALTYYQYLAFYDDKKADYPDLIKKQAIKDEKEELASQFKSLDVDLNAILNKKEINANDLAILYIKLTFGTPDEKEAIYTAMKGVTTIHTLINNHFESLKEPTGLKGELVLKDDALCEASLCLEMLTMLYNHAKEHELDLDLRPIAMPQMPTLIGKAQIDLINKIRLLNKSQPLASGYGKLTQVYTLSKLANSIQLESGQAKSTGTKYLYEDAYFAELLHTKNTTPSVTKNIVDNIVINQIKGDTGESYITYMEPKLEKLKNSAQENEYQSDYLTKISDKNKLNAQALLPDEGKEHKVRDKNQLEELSIETYAVLKVLNEFNVKAVKLLDKNDNVSQLLSAREFNDLSGFAENIQNEDLSLNALNSIKGTPLFNVQERLNFYRGQAKSYDREQLAVRIDAEKERKDSYKEVLKPRSKLALDATAHFYQVIPLLGQIIAKIAEFVEKRQRKSERRAEIVAEASDGNNDLLQSDDDVESVMQQPQAPKPERKGILLAEDKKEYGEKILKGYSRLYQPVQDTSIPAAVNPTVNDVREERRYSF